VRVLRLLDAEWLDSIEGAPRIEAAISAFRARGGVVEAEERNVGASAPAPSRHAGSQ
jgi:hypothetical protein